MAGAAACTRVTCTGARGRENSRRQKAYHRNSLLEGGADVNVKNNEGLTPLHLAIVSNRQEVVQLLLNYRANPAFKDAQGDTSLHLAMQKGTPGILQDLCKAKDSDVDVPNHNGVLPLEIAVVKGDLKSVQTLIAAKADPTKTSK
eukprot:264447-Amorphochlora_amoeboformis.AAC.2